MKKNLSVLMALILMFTLVACGKNNSEGNTSMVNNPPQSDQLSYETNKDGYILSCTLSIDGETFTYQCKGENYLYIDDTDGNYVISEIKSVPDGYIGTGETVKRIYFYEGTAQEFVIQEYREDEIAVIGTHIQIFNRKGELIVDQTPRNDFEDYYYSLIYSNSGWPVLFDNLGQPAQDSNGNYIIDEKAVVITEPVAQRIENGIRADGNLTSVYYYDIDTGRVIYSCIYNVDTTYTISVYDRNDYHLVYQEINDYETLSERIYNADGSYSETITDMNTMQPISQGDYNADGTPIA